MNTKAIHFDGITKLSGRWKYTLILSPFSLHWSDFCLTYLIGQKDRFMVAPLPRRQIINNVSPLSCMRISNIFGSSGLCRLLGTAFTSFDIYAAFAFIAIRSTANQNSKIVTLYHWIGSPIVNWKICSLVVRKPLWQPHRQTVLPFVNVGVGSALEWNLQK